MSNLNTRGSGVLFILPSTVVAGLLGYVITVILARYLGQDYSNFAVFWASLYFIVGALTGIQQEFSRLFVGDNSRESGIQNRSVLAFLFRYSLVITVIVGLLSFVLLSVTKNIQGQSFIPQLLVGIFFNILLVGLAGFYYGTQRWLFVALIILSDVVLRLLLLLAGIYLQWDVIAISWLVVIPIPTTFILLYFATRRTLSVYWKTSVPQRLLIRNINLTIYGALGSSLLVSGIPVLISFSNRDLNSQELSALIFTLILTRAPLIVGVLALQSLLVVKFKEASHKQAVKLVLIVIIAITLIGIALATCAYIFGPQIIVMLAGESFQIPAANVALLTLLSIPTGILAVSGAFTLAGGRHFVYAAGWTVAALIATICFLLIPESYLAAILALGIAPMLGSLLHFSRGKITQKF